MNQFEKKIEIYFITSYTGFGKLDYAKTILLNHHCLDHELVKYHCGKWYGVINGSGACIYDNFNDDDIPIDEFLNFIDIVPHDLNVNNKSVLNNYNLIIFTSTFPFESFYYNIRNPELKQKFQKLSQNITKINITRNLK